ncbi:hypothetical protein GMOD_00007379 [Pyrenophora seminiperda CCB06]|uniref:Uncharacterized protein n=1 Tax=Pyrenophora seminiperda CCB06 TaxID=1302712 RepID=A0A3M7MD59_9PLEO|nr:hypothetical protein GMOD_00007379 [Pyrenophora seminiperda CCB06]
MGLLNLDGAESGVFCQECLYITGKDRNHAWDVLGHGRDCEACKQRRRQDWHDRKPGYYFHIRRDYSLVLPGGSDIHVPT